MRERVIVSCNSCKRHVAHDENVWLLHVTTGADQHVCTQCYDSDAHRQFSEHKVYNLVTQFVEQYKRTHTVPFSSVCNF